MELRLLGADHRTAPLAERERLALPRERRESFLREVLAAGVAAEALLLSTCNRTEIYLVAEVPDAGERALRLLLDRLSDPPADATPFLRARSGDEAAEHLLRVASGLESAVLGESEIQGQVREAVEAATAVGACGKVLDRLAQAALRAGKRVRSETRLGAGGASHGSAAAEVTRRVFGMLSGRTVLVVGAGTMASQTARALATLGGRFVVANRTPEHAEALAKDLGPATTTSLDEVGPLLREAHVLVLATESWVLARREVATALPRRRDPLLIVDLGLPRVVEPSTADLPGVFLYGVEDLERIVGASLAARREAIPAAEAIVAEEAARFAAWSRALRVHPALSTLQTWAEALRRDEVAGLPAEMSEADRKVVDALTRRLVQKILGRPASRVVEGATNEDPALPTAEHLKRVFGLDETEDR